MKIEDLKNYLVIDKGSLDDEVSKQAMLFFQVSEAYVDAAAEQDACKEELTSIDAELDGECRTILANNEDKVTEAMVKNAIQVHTRHKDAFDTYITAKTKADMLQALKEAFAQRGYMLRDLAQLIMTSYYDQTSIGPAALDRAKYQRNRERLAEAREGRAK